MAAYQSPKLLVGVRVPVGMPNEETMFLQKNLKLNDEELSFVDFVMSSNFPWFYNTNTSFSDRFHYFAHTVLHRNKNELEEGIKNSAYSDICLNLFYRFCDENNISVNTIFRATLNLSLYDPAEINDKHIDHTFPHNVFLLYLNDFDNGSTVVYDNEKIIHEFKPKKFDGIVFPGQPHANRHCDIAQRRIVLVVSFN
jgi:hypothetical protein